MDKFGNLLSKWQKKSPIMRGVVSSMVVEHFTELLKAKWGAAIEEQARVLHLKNQTLTVACLNSMIASEIKLNERSFLEKINAKFGETTVLKLKFML
jgi:predicted nucleic acid-binding Zn ribbon protein